MNVRFWSLSFEFPATAMGAHTSVLVCCLHNFLLQWVISIKVKRSGFDQSCSFTHMLRQDIEPFLRANAFSKSVYDEQLCRPAGAKKRCSKFSTFERARFLSSKIATISTGASKNVDHCEHRLRGAPRNCEVTPILCKMFRSAAMAGSVERLRAT